MTTITFSALDSAIMNLGNYTDNKTDAATDQMRQGDKSKI